MTDVDLPPIVGGRYRPLRLIGRGGMGAVYEVEHVHTGERLALKILVTPADGAPSPAQSGNAVERFKREARASAQIRSENVVRVTDADVAPELKNAPYVVMELLDGSDLEVGAADRPQAPETVVQWLRQVARGLDKAHRLGIIHRDLKPANLFLTRREDGTPLVKILDFGIAKMTDAGPRTTTGEMVGTPLFMAPEQALAEVEPSGATDRYALGLIAYRLLFGRPYWRTHAIAQLLNEVLYVPMPAPSTRESHFGAPFDAWFARACAREPRARFTSAAEQVEALAAALNVEVLPIAIDPTQSVERGNPPSNAETRALELAPTLQMSASTVSGARGRASQLPSAPARRAAVLVAIGVAILAVVTIALRTSPVPTPPSIATAPSPRAVIDASVSPALPPSPSVAEVLSPAPPPAPSTAPSAKPALSARPATSASLSPLPRSTPKAAPSSAKPAPSLDPFADQK